MRPSFLDFWWEPSTNSRGPTSTPCDCAGISHYVAVSGANVAGFLLLWFIVLGPLGIGGRRRGVLGLVAVAVFAVATRWEPSVVRASLMAGLVLVGRAIGVPVDSWTALGWSGALALLVAPELTESIGFQLSVLATAGIMSGGDLLPGSLPGWLRGSLGPDPRRPGSRDTAAPHRFRVGASRCHLSPTWWLLRWCRWSRCSEAWAR